MNSRIIPSAARPAAMACLMVSWLAALPARAFIGEPETLVYGRILNRHNPNAEELVTAGDLRWSIRKPDGSIIQLSGEIDVLDGGQISYLLRIPHQAVMLGQAPAPQTVPLGTSPALAYHTAITVDGAPAGILPPATSGIDLDQLLRAGTIRLDLEINAASEDTDGDGMPDWWEDEHGLDKQNGGDALTDLNGNGLNNLAEYLAGNDPDHNPVKPLLLTRELIAYADAESLVPLEVADSDSTPVQLVFTLHSLPDGGRLLFRNAAALPAETGRLLAPGDTFTRADVMAGRLVFDHETGATTGAFDVGVRDEDPSHEESRGEVMVRLFESNAAITATTVEESMRLDAHGLARDHGHLVADFGATAGPHRLAAPTAGLSVSAYQTHVTSFGEERPHILLGGPSTDTLNGGAADDFIFGDDGVDTLSGGLGADTFRFTEPSAAVDAITDFNPMQGDIIDLRGVLNGPSTLLTQYVRIRRSGSDALLEVSAAGTGSGFTDLVIRLQGSSLQPADVANLHYSGNLETGAIGLPPRLSIAATTAVASENGPTDGVFTITREGDAEVELAVNLTISGNASNGADYQLVSSPVTLPAGETSVTVTIRPFVDAQVEFNEVVQIFLASSPDYSISTASSAQVSIEDLKPQLSLEVLDGLAGVAESAPGVVLVRRGGLTSPEVFAQFTLSGSAVNGTDYNFVTPYLTLSSGQTLRMIEFVPKPAVNFGTAEAKTIRMTLKADASYVLPAPVANLLVVPRRWTYGGWLAEHGLVGGNEDVLLPHYGFGIDPLHPYSAAGLARMPRVVIDGDHLTLRFRRKPGITDLQYQVEYSNDLFNWSSGPTAVEDISSQAAPNDPGAAVFRAKRTISEADHAAMRVRLTLPEPPSE